MLNKLQAVNFVEIKDLRVCNLYLKQATWCISYRESITNRPPEVLAVSKLS
jgi:hypothetical protein